MFDESNIYKANHCVKHGTAFEQCFTFAEQRQNVDIKIDLFNIKFLTKKTVNH